MKKVFLILTIIVMTFGMTGCFNSNNKETDEEKNSPQTNEAYKELLTQYTKALKEKWTGSDLSINDMSLMMLDCYGSNPQENIGYTLLDLDNDNSKELIIATTNAITDDFYGKLVFDVYTLNEKGTPVKVLTSTERDRYYYAGKNKFANLGSNSAGNDVDTTVKIENGKTVDLNHTTASTDYKQLELTLMK